MLWQAGGFAQRTQPAQTRSSQPSSSVGRIKRSSLPPPRLAPQWQLRNQPWRGGVSQRSSRAVGTARKDPLATGRFRLLRRQAAEFFGTAPAALLFSGQAPPLGEARRPASGGMAYAGRPLPRGLVSAPTARLDCRAAIRG